ncbi:MAG: polysaccharide pyruvyl transferase family protein [Bacteroidales bacterium]|nr:polysaccharide pyruvyl transferase family protein [Bacteroidales bacterium]
MRIGIITQPLTTNYGGILQNYALQYVLKEEGHDVFTFDLGRYNILDWAILLAKIIVNKLLGKKVVFPMTPSLNKRREAPLRQFVKEHINLIEPRTVRPKNRSVAQYGLDCLIVGSDQVWRPRYTLHISDMFISFYPKDDVLKLSYAASFGTDIWEFSKSETSTCKQLVKKFKGVSVRENSGVRLCKEFLGVNATHVLDPTLLLQSSEYCKLCEGLKRKDSFVFAYILDTRDCILDEIKEFAERRGLPVLIKRAGRELDDSDSIELWLSYFRDAAFVITDSFHGTAFSINFNKEFLVYGNEERGNSRFSSLLSVFNLKGRMVEHVDNTIPPIDWQEVNTVLLKERERSMMWLQSVLNND